MTSIGMFRVIDIRRSGIWKLVRFEVLTDMVGTEPILTGLRHDLSAVAAPYSFANGSSFQLKYPFWNRLQRGDSVDLATLLRHPDVRRELIWKARQLSRR